MERVNGWVVVFSCVLGVCVVCVVLCVRVLLLLLSSARADGAVDSGRTGRIDLVVTDVEPITSLHTLAATVGREVGGGQCDGMRDGWDGCVGSAEGITGAMVGVERDEVQLPTAAGATEEADEAERAERIEIFTTELDSATSMLTSTTAVRREECAGEYGMKCEGELGRDVGGVTGSRSVTTRMGK